MSQPKRFDVDLVVTCFERTYRKVLRPGFVIGIATQNQFAFKAKTVLINNVESRATVEELARQLVARGEIDRFDFVEDHIEAAPVCGSPCSTAVSVWCQTVTAAGRRRSGPAVSFSRATTMPRSRFASVNS